MHSTFSAVRAVFGLPLSVLSFVVNPVDTPCIWLCLHINFTEFNCFYVAIMRQRSRHILYYKTAWNINTVTELNWADSKKCLKFKKNTNKENQAFTETQQNERQQMIDNTHVQLTVSLVMHDNYIMVHVQHQRQVSQWCVHCNLQIR